MNRTKPANIMGAAKRAVELIIFALQYQDTQFHNHAEAHWFQGTQRGSLVSSAACKQQSASLQSAIAAL
jgi:hypothetical protein